MSMNTEAITSKITSTVTESALEAMTLIDDIADMRNIARRLKAVTQAFDDAFTQDATGVDMKEITARPEQFANLFYTLEYIVFEVEDKAIEAEDHCSAFLDAHKVKASA